jgi:hypothetical protein
MSVKTLVALLLLMSTATLVNDYEAAKCYNIKDSDLRQQCLATKRDSISNCFNIKDRDQQNFCKAVESVE